MAAIAPPGAFGFTEDELSDDARAILAYARKWAAPFTRTEIVAVAPGAAWDTFSRYPSTVAALDPIRELVRAGLVVEYDQVPVKNSGKSYKRWALTGADHPRTLAELLDTFAEAVRTAASDDESLWTIEQAERDREEVRAEIVRRFDRG